MTTNEDFEKWYHQYIDNGYSAQAFEVNMFEAWQAATTEASKRIAELEVQLQNWKDFSKKVQKIDFNDYLQLQASNNHLREALVICKQFITEAILDDNYHEASCGLDEIYNLRDKAIKLSEAAISATPAESLQAHDGEVAKCKVDAERYQFVRQLTPREFSEIYDINLKSGVHFDHLISQALKEVK
jgi:hypothetical protein